jgi:CheY-like chemotaxis protein
VALADAGRRKDHLLARLAHELRGPMAPLLNSLLILEQTDADADRRKESLQRMRRELGHLSRLIDDLLGASHVTQGKAQIRKDPPVAKAGRRVLIIEDGADAAESLCMLLGMAGHQTKAAHSGPEGVRMAAEWLPEVVVSDLGLPGFDGYEVAQRVRRLPGMERVLLIALTGYGSEEDRRKGREAGFHHHLVKPAQPEDIERMVAGTLPG